MEAQIASIQQRTEPAVQLVTSEKLGVYQKSIQPAKSGISLQTTCQSGVYKATLKVGETFKAHFVETLKYENCSLHFDGKRIKKT